MQRILSILIGAILITLIAPIPAELPSDAVNLNHNVVNQSAVTYANPASSVNSIASENPMDPGHFWGKYFWGNMPAIYLSGTNPDVFQSAAFSKYPGGLLSDDMYTSSIRDFIKDNPSAGASNVAKKAARIGLVYWPGQA
jgi:hypothetical protein